MRCTAREFNAVHNGTGKNKLCFLVDCGQESFTSHYEAYTLLLKVVEFLLHSSKRLKAYTSDIFFNSDHGCTKNEVFH